MRMPEILLLIALILGPIRAWALTGADVALVVAEAMRSEGLEPAELLFSPQRRLPACDTSDLRATAVDGGWHAVDITCAGSRSWTRRLRTDLVAGFEPRQDGAADRETGPMAVVAARTLSRDSIIGPDDVTLAVVSARSSNLRFETLDDVIGRRLLQPITVGSAIAPRHLERDWLVLEGDRLQLEFQAGPISVSVQVVAMENGEWGQSIDVSNPSSGRAVPVIVQGRGFVVPAANISTVLSD